MFQNIEKFWEFGGGRMVLATLAAHSVSVSIGISQGYSAILLPQLQDNEESEKLRNLTNTQLSWIASLGAISNPIGSVLSGVFAEYFGRKRSIQFTSLPFILGWLCLGLAQDVNWLYAGRLITGIAGGMSTACYTYVSEISTPERRGIMQSIGPICASFGILYTYVLGYLLKWYIVAYTSIIFATFSVIAMQFLPETPGYLLSHNKTTEGFDVLLWFRRSNAIAQQELDRYNENKRGNDSKQYGELRKLYFSPQTVKPFLYLVVLFLLQEFSGIYTLLFYAVNFFQETDLNINEYVASIIVGVIRFGMSLFAAYLINRYGRKILCTYSSLGMAITMLIVAVYVKYYEIFPDKERILPYLPLIGVIFNVIFCMIGMLPIPWVMVGEMFPLEVRPIMSGIVICLAQIFIFICVKIYDIMNDRIKFSGTLLTFVSASILSIIFCKFFLPETKNKSLEEIEALFRKKPLEVSGIYNDGFDNSSEQNTKEQTPELVTVTIN